MTRTMISAPEGARAGDVIEIKAMIAHPMETGYRVDATGKPIARDIITRFQCTYDGEVVFSADLFPAISANPFIAFSTVATRSGPISFTWTDAQGRTETASAEIKVE